MTAISMSTKPCSMRISDGNVGQHTYYHGMRISDGNVGQHTYYHGMRISDGNVGQYTYYHAPIRKVKEVHIGLGFTLNWVLFS